MRSFVASLVVLFLSFAASAQTSSFPPSPKVLLAVNPVTNKIYSLNEAANSVTVFNGASGTSKTIAVGSRPQFIAINPITNRIYVNNGGEASVSVIDGSTDTNITPTPLQVGSQGPMAINAETNVVYIVRMTSVATDEVTFLNGNDNTWYTIATESFQPTALTINPFTNTLYVAHYGTGDVRVISGVYNNTVLHPTTFSIGAWSKPFAIAASPSNDKVYVITEDSRGPIGIIDGATRTAQFPLPSPGHAAGPKSVVVNPTTGVAYAAFNGEVIVINGTSYAYIPVATGAGQVGLAVNPLTNKIYVSSDTGTLTIIDGDNNTTTTVAIPAGAQSVAANPVTNKVIVHGPTPTIVDGTGTPHGSVISTTISPQPGNSSGPNPTFSISATNFSSNPLPIRGVFVQMDGRDGAWTAASGGGGSYSASFSGLSAGSHTLNAFAIEGQVAPVATGPESMPLVGAIASYTFTVTGAKADPTVSLLSSGNPSAAGQSVTFTASVTGNATNAPTGTMAFKDGTTTLCAAVTMTSGSATCSTSTLASGAHTITATYSGDTNYNTASATLTQNVGKVASTTALTSSANPSTFGQSVTLTAAVSGGTGTATGTVTFTEGTTTLCSAVALASGSAACTTSALTGGAHTITATYSGDSSRNTSSGSVTQTVNRASASVASSATPNPANFGQAITLTATVTGAGATPTGTVDFVEGTTAISGCSAVAMVSGKASCTVSSLASGNHSIVAKYSGSTNHNAASSSALTVTVNACTTCPPDAPSQTAPSGTTNTSTPTYSWNASAGATSYWLLVQNTQGVAVNQAVSAAQAGCSAGGTCSFNPQVSLPNGSKWAWYLRAINGNGESNWSDGLQFTVAVADTGPTLPARPTQVSPSGEVTTTRPTYVWNASPGATSYSMVVQNTSSVAVSVSLTAAQAGCSSGTTCSYMPDTALPNGTRWSWYVKAANSAGETNWSDGLSFRVNAATTPPADPPPPPPPSQVPQAPAQVSPTGTGPTMPTYTWNASSGATSYWLLVQNTQGVAVNQAVSAMQAGCGNGGTCSFQPSTTLPDQSSWAWYVKASNTMGESGWSTGLQFRVDAGSSGGGTPPPPPPATSAPSAPMQVSPTGNIGTTMPTYTWNASSGASSYYIVVQNTNGVAVSITLSAAQAGCASSSMCSYHPAQALPSNTPWAWYVKASNSMGESGWSNGLQFRTP